MLSGRGVLKGRDVYNPQRELGAGNTLSVKAPIGVLQNLIVTPFQGYQVVGITLLRLTPEVIDLAPFQDALIYGKTYPQCQACPSVSLATFVVNLL